MSWSKWFSECFYQFVDQDITTARPQEFDVGLAINEGQDMTAADKVLGYTAAVRLLSTNRVTRPIVCFQWTSHTFGLTAHPI